MYYKKILSLLLFTALVNQGCATTYKEHITSDPSGAEIYWGYSESNFVDTDYVTPFERSIYGKAWEARCYQVRKKGYYDSQVLCRSTETGDRLIHFDLTAKPAKVNETTNTPEASAKKTLAIRQKYSETAKASSSLLAEAVKETIPGEEGPAVQYIQRYLEDNGYKCYVEIFRSRKYHGKFAIVINRHSSEVNFNKDKFTEAAILAAAILAEHVRWDPSELLFNYYAIFEIENKSVGWAIISVKDCIAARKVFMSTRAIDKFTSFWKSKIHYISNTDPEPPL